MVSKFNHNICQHGLHARYGLLRFPKIAQVQVLQRPCSLHNEDRVVHPHSKLSYESWEDMCDWSLSGGDLGPNGSVLSVYTLPGPNWGGGLPDGPECLGKPAFILAIAEPRQNVSESLLSS